MGSWDVQGLIWLFQKGVKVTDFDLGVHAPRVQKFVSFISNGFGGTFSYSSMIFIGYAYSRHQHINHQRLLWVDVKGTHGSLNLIYDWISLGKHHLYLKPIQWHLPLLCVTSKASHLVLPSDSKRDSRHLWTSKPSLRNSEASFVSRSLRRPTCLLFQKSLFHSSNLLRLRRVLCQCQSIWMSCG